MVFDLPCMQKLIRDTGAVIVPVDMCMWGKGPQDRPLERYRMRRWLLVSPNIAEACQFLRRTCNKDHAHNYADRRGNPRIVGEAVPGGRPIFPGMGRGGR